MPVTIEVPVNIRIAQKVLRFLAKQGKDVAVKAGILRAIGLLDGNATESQRDSVMEGLRTLGCIEPYGGSGRGRSYRLTPLGWDLLTSMNDSYGVLDVE